MVAVALAAAATAAAAAATPYYFQIEPVVRSTTGADIDFEGYYLTSFHVGAGESTIVGTKNETNAAKFYIDGQHYLREFIGRSDIPDPNLGLLDQRPYMSDAPAGYDYVSLNFNNDKSGEGFGITHDAGTLNFYAGYTGQHAGWKGWALCHVNGTSPYFSVGPQVQLLWQTESADVTKTNCARVSLNIRGVN